LSPLLSSPAELVILQLAFLIYNAVIGVLVGWASVRSPFFAGLALPSFAWLVLGMLAFELLSGLALRAHPASVLSMGSRIAGLLVAFGVCYSTMEILRVA
jgi:hypothetical protein